MNGGGGGGVVHKFESHTHKRLATRTNKFKCTLSRLNKGIHLLSIDEALKEVRANEEWIERKEKKKVVQFKIGEF